MSASEGETKGPLHGIRVIDAGRYLAAPFCAQILGDYGADVIKVESPSAGDPFRSFGGDKDSPTFTAFNRNKRSLAVDMKNEDDRRFLYDLIRTSDVFIENARPGTMQKLGFGFQKLSELNDRLVYCSISGMGQTGPYAHRPVYDTIGQALSGLLSLMVDSESPEVVGPAFADTITSMTAVSGIMAALVSRSESGKGQLVDVSMLSSMVAFLTSEVVWDGELDGQMSRRHRPSLSLAFAMSCADMKFLAIHISSSEKFWFSFVDAIGVPAFHEDERFDTYASRVRHYEQIEEILRPVFRSKTRGEWMELLEAKDVPHAPIYTVAEVLNDPQARHLGIPMIVKNTRGDDVVTPAPPVRFSNHPQRNLPPIARLGEHNDEIVEQVRSQLSNTEQRDT